MWVGFRDENGIPTLECLGLKFDSVANLGFLCPVGHSGDAIATTLSQWNTLVIDCGLGTTTTASSGRSIVYSRGQFFPVHLASRHLWPTVLAQPTHTLDLTPDEIASRRALPTRLEGLKFCLGLRLLITQGGSMGLAPRGTQRGDLIAILLGAPVPHILRQRSDGRYNLVVECYVHGIMGGEALAHLSQELRGLGHRSRPFPKMSSSAGLEIFEIQ